MTEIKEQLAIKNIVLSVIARLEDIRGLYIKESTGEMLSIYKVARGQDKQLDSIKIQNITKTRIAIGMQIKIYKKSNAPIIYRKLKKMILEDLKEIKFSLVKLNLSIIDVE